MTTFAKFFKFKDFEAMIAASEANPRPEGKYDDPGVSKWYEHFHDLREKSIVKPAMKFFKAKLKAGELKPVPNSQGRSINFAFGWDCIVAPTPGTEDYHKTWAMESIERLFGSLILSPHSGLWQVFYRDEIEKEFDAKATYDQIIAFFDKGDFPFHSVSEYQACGKTGEYIHVQFEDWTPVLGKPCDTGGKLREFVKCEPITTTPEIKTLQIEFKTGNLVAMDWFRGFDGALEAFLNARGADKLPSINSSAGIYKTTQFHADLGIVHVFVGNSSPNVFTGNGIIAVGNNWREFTADGRERYSDCDDDGNESEEAYEEYENAQENPPVGMVDNSSVCTDLWWITMMERERLIEIFVEQLGEELRGEIEEYANGDFDVNIQVEPGKYTLHYDAHPSEFFSILDDKTKFGIGTPYFALTKDKIE